MAEKLCVFCEYFQWRMSESGDYGCSERASCAKGHFRFEIPEDTDEWRKLLLTAKECPDYSPPSPKE